jgi:UDP-N-acetylglucosamine 2-epimerase (non-hydrolysing)
MKISIILGTRPEIIKMSPVIRECEKQNLDYFILHTGQHYSYNLDKIFFQELELPEAKNNLDVGSATHAEETGKMLIGIEKVLQEEKPDVVLAEGDTNTVLAGALAASKLHIKVGHVEAGLRSYDRNMPEEINRVLADHVSDYLFAPTEKAKENLLREGIPSEKVFVTGNTIVDAVYQNLEIAKRKVNILNKLNLRPNEYLLVTAHRQENVDDKERLKGILDGLELVYNELNLPIIYPIHPRTMKKIREFELEVPKGIKLIEPLGFLEFLQLEANAKLVLTDSGGVQEETCILKVPCVTLRGNTERPETLEVGSNVLAGVNPDKILEGVKIMLSKERNWINPFGDGKAGSWIVEILALYQRDVLSSGKACARARMTRWEFEEFLGQRQIRRHYTEKNLEEDIKYARSHQ